MRIAVAGLGGAATRGHLPAISVVQRSGRARLTAVAEPDRERRAALLRLRPDVAGFDSVEELLATIDCDVLVVATEPDRHASLAALALERGVHVVCEKPVAPARDQLDLLDDAVARSPSRAPALVPVHQYRYSPAWASVSRWARLAARLRQPFSIVVDVERIGSDSHAASAWRDDMPRTGGMLADAGVHFLALAWTLDPRMVVLGGARIRDDRHEQSIGIVGVGSGLLVARVRTGADARRTRVQVRAAGTLACWSDDALTLGVPGWAPVRRRVPALSERAHVDALYVPFYVDLVRHLRDPGWCLRRTAEALEVSRALTDLLAQTPVTTSRVPAVWAT